MGLWLYMSGEMVTEYQKRMLMVDATVKIKIKITTAWRECKIIFVKN
jgi:hypothetical protein